MSNVYQTVRDLVMKIDERIRGMLRASHAKEIDGKEIKTAEVQMGDRRCVLTEELTPLGMRFEAIRAATVTKGNDVATVTLDDGLITIMVNGKTLTDGRIDGADTNVLLRALPLLDKLANESCCAWRDQPADSPPAAEDPLEALDRLAA
jgi:hypothetical protein